jgi:hypothetical protein
VAQRADQRPAVAHQRVGDQRRGRRHRRLTAGEQLGVLQISVPAQGADVDAAVRVDPVIVQARDRVDVDQQLG